MKITTFMAVWIVAFGCMVRSNLPGCFAAEPTTAPALEQPVWLEGTLLGPDGQPAVDGFVMVGNDPYLNAITDEQGRFRIDADSDREPDVLLASWSGSELAQTPIGARTKKGIEIRLKAQDPEFTKIEVGAALHCLYNGMSKDYYQRKHPFSKDEQTCVSAYEAFLKDRGEKIIQQIVAGEELAPGDARYIYLLHAELGVRTFFPRMQQHSPLQDYYEKLIGRAREVLRRAWKHEPLTPADLKVLRCFHAEQELHPGNGGGGSWGGVAGFSQYKGDLGDMTRKLGDPLTAIFLRFDPLTDAPGASRYSSLSLTEFIRFEGLGHLFSQFAVELPVGRRFVPATAAQLRRRFWHDDEQPVALADFAANGKPTLYFWTQLEDRTYPRWSGPFVEYIRRAYRGQANVVISSVMSPNYADMWVDDQMYYGPNPKIDPLHGLDCRPYEEDFTPQRSARETRILCMEYPFFSAPIVLEPIGGDADSSSMTSLRLPQSYYHMMVMDNRGQSCDRDWSMLDITGGWWQFSYFDTYSDCLEFIFPRVETVLRAVIANGGHVVPDIEKRLLVPIYPKRQLAYRDEFVVKSVDEKTGIVRAAWFKFTKPAGITIPTTAPAAVPPGDFRFKFSPDTRIELNHKISKLQDVKPGQHFWADFMLDEPLDKPRTSIAARTKDYRLRPFEMAQYADKVIDTVRILDYPRQPMTAGSGDLWLDTQLYGRVSARKGNIITVAISRDDLKDMYGPRFWKEDQKIASPTRFGESYPSYYPAGLYRDTIRRWLDGTDEDRTYRFALDRAVRVFRNGQFENVTAADIAVGDYVWVTYEAWWESSGQYRQIIYPDRIFASTPVNASAQPGQQKRD